MFSISESLERQHVSDSILPWAIKFQQEYDKKLFTIKDIELINSSADTRITRVFVNFVFYLTSINVICIYVWFNQYRL